MEAGGDATRIYVGGLGAGVTEDDLRQTFSSLGEVLSVDVLRTKGRSFAYLDFLPSSDKSLPKLFSTYNGCVWKGGKLRLEKAKEHYLVRLRREWEEESQNANTASATCNDSHDASEKPNKTSMADRTQLGQIRIFFPKLHKVKSLASVGIGKHKYSFQRVEVPSIPTHFCDCEEHSRPFLTSNKKQASDYFEDACSGINEQELNIMNSVMNKIFERENPSTKQVNERDISIKSNDEFLADENDEEDHLTDEDNLVINVANGKGDSMDLLAEMRSMMANQEPVANRLRSSSEKTKNVKKKPISEENKTRNSQDSKKQLGSNSLRSLKSTWKDLTAQTPFSISNIIANVAEKDVPKNVKNTPKKKKRKLDTIENDDCHGPKGSEPKETITSEQFSTSEQKEEGLPKNIEITAKKKRKVDTVENDDCHGPKETTIAQQLSESEQKEEVDIKSKSSEKHENEQDMIRTARGESWRHKSSWTQLISNTMDTPFTISQVVPTLPFQEPHHHQLHNDESPAEQKVSSDKSNATHTSSSVAMKKKLLSLGNLEYDDETCPFMRTEQSIKDWNKAKTSVNKKKTLDASK